MATPSPITARPSITRRSTVLMGLRLPGRRNESRLASEDRVDLGLQLAVAVGQAHDRLGLALGAGNGQRWRAGEALGGSGQLVVLDLRLECRVMEVSLPAGEVESGHVLGQLVQIGLGHVIGVLRALVVVEELDVVPLLVLKAG